MTGGPGESHDCRTNTLTAARDEKAFGLHIGAQIIGRPLRFGREMPSTWSGGHQTRLIRRVGALRAGDAHMDWGFIVFVGTMLFFAALHQWPPDGKRWQRKEITIKEQEAATRRRGEGPPLTR